MKKQWVLGGICSSFFFLSGCNLRDSNREPVATTSSSQTISTDSQTSEKELYDEAMQIAQEAIGQHDWNKALLYLDKALQVKKTDKTAQSQRTQVQILQSALQAEKEEKYQEALQQLNNLFNQEESSEILSFAKEKQKAIKQIIAEQEAAIWDTTKAEKLKEFMANWGQMMGQRYEEYTPENSVDYYGVYVPGAILNGEFTMAFDEQPVSVEWSKNGLGTKEYQLVAVYSDAATQPYIEKHIYFFVFHQGQPMTLVTQQTQGNPYNYLYFYETKNVDLRTGFLKIAEGS